MPDVTTAIEAAVGVPSVSITKAASGLMNDRPCSLRPAMNVAVCRRHRRAVAGGARTVPVNPEMAAGVLTLRVFVMAPVAASNTSTLPLTCIVTVVGRLTFHATAHFA
jgi:hypothetical protein